MMKTSDPTLHSQSQEKIFFPVSDVKQDSNEQLKTPGYQFSASKESKHVT